MLRLCLNGRYCTLVTFVKNMLVKRTGRKIFSLTKGNEGVWVRQEVRLEVRPFPNHATADVEESGFLAT